MSWKKYGLEEKKRSHVGNSLTGLRGVYDSVTEISGCNKEYYGRKEEGFLYPRIADEFMYSELPWTQQ
jgi:hypothetical protein